jgi:hypothetical protein
LILNPWKEIKRLKAIAAEEEARLVKTLDRMIEMEDALWQIIELETPRASNGVKKAARIARETIGWE